MMTRESGRCEERWMLRSHLKLLNTLSHVFRIFKKRDFYPRRALAALRCCPLAAACGCVPPPPAAAAAVLFVGGDARSPRCAAYRRRNLRRRVESPLGDAWVPASDGGSTDASSAPPSRPGSLAASGPPSPPAAAPRDPAG